MGSRLGNTELVTNASFDLVAMEIPQLILFPTCSTGFCTFMPSDHTDRKLKELYETLGWKLGAGLSSVFPPTYSLSEWVKLLQWAPVSISWYIGRFIEIHKAHVASHRASNTPLHTTLHLVKRLKYL